MAQSPARDDYGLATPNQLDLFLSLMYLKYFIRHLSESDDDWEADGVRNGGKPRTKVILKANLIVI